MPAEQLAEALAAAAEEVLDLMFFTTVLSTHASAPDYTLPVSAQLEFRGEPAGSFGVNLSTSAAEAIASNFLGEEPDALSPEQIRQVVCELANMMCGALLTRVHSDNMFELTSPELQEAGRGAAFAKENPSRVFDTGDGLIQAYLQVN